MTESFAGFVIDLNHGLTDKLLMDTVREVAKQVAAVEKPGSLTFTVNIRPFKNNKGIVIVTTDLKAKLPKEPDDQVFFIGDDGTLTTRDERQLSLDELEDVRRSSGGLMEDDD